MFSASCAEPWRLAMMFDVPFVADGSDLMAGTVLGNTDDTGRQMGAIRGRHTHVQVRDPFGNLVDPLTYFKNCK